ncbi:hypothetical protein [Massilia sp. DWR3-1-1]|uniref:hypothetical protein n=1 Tax=Massilia sp. DWR3-1-1 TaxID=2804559 RepID=UPI003CF4F70D
MLNSSVLEVAIGLSFCYASLALIVSTVQEALASALHLRAHTLLDGIKTMLNDPRFNGMARALYSHALINPHDDGQAGQQDALKHKPSYIEPLHFAIALIDTIGRVPGNIDKLGQDIDTLRDPQLRRALQGIYLRANGNFTEFEDGVAAWFDSAMARVSGEYKRRSMLVSVLLSLLLTVLFNIDSIHLFKVLWQHPALAAQIAAVPTAADRATIDLMFSLPIGWQTFPPAFDGSFLLQVAGWLITTSSSLFGAPFWFSTLQKIMQLRGTGAKPDEQRPLSGPRGVRRTWNDYAEGGR